MAEPIEDLPGEVWKPVVGFEGLYEVSNMGRVKSLARIVRAGSRSQPVRERILATPCVDPGYKMVNLHRRGHKAKRWVHSLVLEAFHGCRPTGCACRHMNGDPTDNRAANLRWGSYAENSADQKRHGTAIRGERVGGARLHPRSVAEIKRQLPHNTDIELGRLWGVARQTIHAIRTGRTWKHI